jgi:hypothetical protein
MRYYVSRQIPWGNATLDLPIFVVEIAYAGMFPREHISNYAGPDMLVPEFAEEGEGQAYATFEEALKAAKEVLKAWTEELVGAKPSGWSRKVRKKDVAIFFMDEELDRKEEKQWIERMAKQEPRCSDCSEILTSRNRTTLCRRCAESWSGMSLSCEACE